MALKTQMWLCMFNCLFGPAEYREMRCYRVPFFFRPLTLPLTVLNKHEMMVFKSVVHTPGVGNHIRNNLR